ncbi:MAG: hypothetical protein Q7T83_01755 [Thermodesulfovibrionales bacterium]|nr:hypothetical protein [Thermodesulfovibrionales bacterium]
MPVNYIGIYSNKIKPYPDLKNLSLFRDMELAQYINILPGCQEENKFSCNTKIEMSAFATIEMSYSK